MIEVQLLFMELIEVIPLSLPLNDINIDIKIDIIHIPTFDKQIVKTNIHHEYEDDFLCIFSNHAMNLLSYILKIWIHKESVFCALSSRFSSLPFMQSHNTR